MSMTDPIADYLIRVRNAANAKHKYVDIPASRVKAQMSKILLDAGDFLIGGSRNRALGGSDSDVFRVGDVTGSNYFNGGAGQDQFFNDHGDGER